MLVVSTLVAFMYLLIVFLLSTDYVMMNDSRGIMGSAGARLSTRESGNEARGGWVSIETTF